MHKFLFEKPELVILFQLCVLKLYAAQVVFFVSSRYHVSIFTVHQWYTVFLIINNQGATLVKVQRDETWFSEWQTSNDNPYGKAMKVNK